MTISGWILFGFSVLVIICCGVMVYLAVDSTKATVITIIVCAVLIVAAFFGFKWYFNNTASGSRALIDERSNLQKGLQRTVTVYTANGDVIAKYEGKIDIADDDSGCIKFDFEGKRYIYYNCFVETVANLQ